MIIILDCIQTTYEGHINTTDATATRKKNGIIGIRDAKIILNYNTII